VAALDNHSSSTL